MPHKYELTRPALRVLACYADRRSPDPDDVRQLRDSLPNVSMDVPIAVLASDVIRQQVGKRQKGKVSATCKGTGGSEHPQRFRSAS